MTRSLPSAAPEEVGLSSCQLERISGALRQEVEQRRVPGVSALVARRGKVAYFETFGVRDPAVAQPMAKDVIFRIYSMTKPIVSVAAMMLFEEGRFLLSDPLAKYIPDFAGAKVGIERDGRLELVPAARDITIQDIFCHTSGLTYGFRGNTLVQKLYQELGAQMHGMTSAEFVAALAKLPLLYQPGSRWEYSHATDVLGRLVEIWSGMSLGDFLRQRIFKPLDMVDTGFHVPEAQLSRIAQPFPKDPDTGAAVELLDLRRKPVFEWGGGALASTTLDYARFSHMLLGNGTLDGERILGRKTLEYMTADHLNGLPGSFDLLVPGYGFGLGFTVRLHTGVASTPGSIGQYSWGGIAGTTFWVDPAEQLYAVMMIQAPHARVYMRALFRDMVYAAITD
ncbi:MAG TPA: serine hydrolase domain-containing protein [Stellaceae bacterium]